MPLTASTFLEPVGDLRPDYFPLTEAEKARADAGDPGAYADETAKQDAYLAAWIAAAEAATADEAVQALSVRHALAKHVARHFRQKVIRAAVSGVSAAFDTKAAEEWEAMRDALAGSLDAALNPLPTISRPGPRVIPGGAVWSPGRTANRTAVWGAGGGTL